jgi:DNA-binding NtrC family response regulator
MTFAREAASKYKVLVVDDDSSVRFTIVDILSSFDHQCQSASDGAEALNKSMKEHFDAVITDVQMPHMDGITLTRELRKRDPSLPVMVMTGRSDQKIAGHAIANGASVFMSKPFTVQEFLSVFVGMMQDRKVSEQTNQHNMNSGQTGYFTPLI